MQTAISPNLEAKAMCVLNYTVSVLVSGLGRKANDRTTHRVASTRSCWLGVVIVAVMAGIQPAWAEGDECISLYVKRNQIYADAHYCFKTEKALQYFSNRDCIPGKPRLTPSQRRQIAEIEKEARRYCRP
jgi:hypothetical protein